MAQAIHAAVAYTQKHPQRVADTPNVVVLAVEGEDELLGYADHRGVLFHEPDLGDEATAYATISPGSRFAMLPLAGRVTAMT